MHLAYAARLLARRVPVLLLALVLGGLAGYLLTGRTQHYVTTSNVQLVPTKDMLATRAVDPTRFFRTASTLLLDEQVMNAASTRLGGSQTAADIRGSVALSDGAASDILQLAVSGHDAQTSRTTNAAVVAAIESTPNPQATAKVLWTSAPTPAANEKRNALLGSLGTLAAAALAIVVWGALRRPVLDARYVVLGTERAQVFPRTPQAPDEGTLRQWLRAKNPYGLPTLGLPADDLPTTGEFAHALTRGDVGDVEGGRFVCVVATAGRCTESKVEQILAATTGERDIPALVIVSAPTPRARRAPTSGRTE